MRSHGGDLPLLFIAGLLRCPAIEYLIKSVGNGMLSLGFGESGKGRRD